MKMLSLITSFIFETPIKIFLQLKYSQVQKRSKDIDKTVYVTSVAQLQFCKATRLIFQKTIIINNPLLTSSILEKKVIRVVYVRGGGGGGGGVHMNVIAWKNGEVLNKVVISVYFAHKKYSRSFPKLKLRPGNIAAALLPLLSNQVFGVWWWVLRSAFKVTPEVFSWD